MPRVSDLIRGGNVDEGEPRPPAESELSAEAFAAHLKRIEAGDAVVRETVARAGLQAAEGEDPAVVYREIRETTRTAYAAIRAGAPWDLGSVQGAARRLVASQLRADGLFAKTFERRADRYALSDHVVNVAIIATKIGIGLKYDAEELERLALAGLVHDVGMLRVPAEILEKPGSLTPAEMDAIRNHPEPGAALVRSLGAEWRWLATVVAQEHEREDGSGYPAGLRGDDITEFAKVIGLADTYEALTQPRPHRKLFLPLDAVKEIISKSRRAFADRILRGMIQELSAFPVGSLVRLNSGEIGRVLEMNRLAPLRPKVLLLFGIGGRRYAQDKTVDLSRESLLSIQAPVSQEELPA
jgi:HD-GYP domain-containing protein (c-di-GMP phosphodiesterase class II)